MVADDFGLSEGSPVIQKQFSPKKRYTSIVARVEPFTYWLGVKESLARFC